MVLLQVLKCILETGCLILDKFAVKKPVTLEGDLVMEDVEEVERVSGAQGPFQPNEEQYMVLAKRGPCPHPASHVTPQRLAKQNLRGKGSGTREIKLL